MSPRQISPGAWFIVSRNPQVLVDRALSSVKTLCVLPTPGRSGNADGRYGSADLRFVLQGVYSSCPQVQEIQMAVNEKFIEGRSEWFDMIALDCET